jgi:glycosyltransferase involved in cell wall biosynthesis
MHLLITADTVGGVWTYTRELVTQLVRRGVRVTLVSFGEIPSPHQCEWMDGLPTLDFRPTAFRLEWMQDAESDLEASAEYLGMVVDEVKPDLLHLNQFYYGALRTPMPRIVVAHSDVVSWWVGVHGDEPKPTKWMRWYREAVTRGLAAATAVVAPSRWMLEQVGNYYTRPANGSVIYNGRTPTLFNPHVTKEDFVLAVGRIWDSGKQVTLLTENELPLSACIVGSEQHADPALRSNGSLDSGRVGVEFRGAQTEAQLRQLYGRATLYAATSRYEPFGLAPVEAALSRCALVCNDIPSFREIWGEAALYFQKDDAHSLAEQIARLADDAMLRQTYANLAYNRARQRYTAARMADDYLALYNALVPAGVIAA